MSQPQILSYKESGNGFPLVLIHGFCETKELWGDFQKDLSKKYRVICPDLPGFGESPLKKKDPNMRYLADKVHDLLVHLGIKQCVMIGHSLGGYVTLAFAEKYEPMLKGIGLFHSTAYPDSVEKKKNRNKTIDFIEKHGVELFAVSFVPPLFNPPNREKFKEEIQWLTSMAASTPKETVIAVTKGMRERKSRIEVLKNIKVPVLFIIGEEDTAVPLDASLEQSAIPARAVKHILSGTGHMGMIEKKEETIRLVEEFVAVL